MRKFIGNYSGVIIGVAYGLLMRCFIFDKGNITIKFTDLFSVTFIWIVPFIIGITPMLFATNEQLRSLSFRCFRPLVTVSIFFIACFITRVEDLICILIIALPFTVAAMLGGYLVGKLILHLRDKKGIVYSVLLIPLLAAPIEELFKIPSGIYEVKNTVVINSSADSIWQNVVRVKNIGQDEYHKGFFNYAGIPRPLYAELDKDGIGAKRTGHFEGGLIFRETVSEWDLNKKVSFNIQVVPSSIRNTIFDQHILKSDHFKFIGASYQLDKISANKTLLTLSSTYLLSTNINYYASFWGDLLLSDFQQRLLSVIKERCEQ